MGFIQSWRNGVRQGDTENSLSIEEEAVGSKETWRGKGDTDTLEHHHLSSQMNLAPQTLNFTESRSHLNK